jgi:hypothetical protein
MMRQMRRPAFLLALAGCVAFAGSGGPQEFVKESGVAVPMRDGVKLRAEVWRPRGGGKWPTLVYRTPYGRLAAVRSYATFRKAVERGYAVVIQDVRGRYDSEGEYVAYQNEGGDGYDTIEWAATQPWSDGRVGTFGLSYPGAVQWLAAMERPPHLKAMVPAMTFSTPSNFFYSGGVFDLSWIGWIWNNIAPDVRAKKNLPGPKTGEEARAAWPQVQRRMQEFLPLGELPELKGVAPWYFEWMKHPTGDPWWDWAELRAKYARVNGVAVLNFSAWYDEAYGPEGATTNFMGLVAARKGQPQLRTRLLMGPWGHGIPGPGDCKVGERDFCPAVNVDYDAIVLEWMDRYVKGLSEEMPGKPVRYFVMGANEWRDADTWPLPQTRMDPLYLAAPAAAGKPATLQWQKPGKADVRSRFVSDAANPVRDPHPPYSGAHDYRALAARSDVLVFDSSRSRAIPK